MLFSCVSVFAKGAVPLGNVHQWLMFTLRFYKARFFCVSSRANLLETLLCAKIKAERPNSGLFIMQFPSHLLFLDVQSIVFSHIRVPNVHSIVEEQESWPAANSSHGTPSWRQTSESSSKIASITVNINYTNSCVESKKQTRNESVTKC